MNIALSTKLSAQVNGQVNGQRLTFFQEIWNLLFAKPAHCRNVAIVSEEREDIVGEYICVCVGAGGVLVMRPDGACPTSCWRP